jgi:6-phosphogluconolactonase
MNNLRIFAIATVFITALGLLCSCAMTKPEGERLMYIGTYTERGSEGIYFTRMNLATGALSTPELAVKTENPTFLDIDAGGKFLFAVNEVGHFAGKNAGAVSSFAIDNATGKLTLLDQRSTLGDGPCHLVLDELHEQVITANYSGGSVAVIPMQTDGKLGEASQFIQLEGHSIRPRQEQPHAHCVALDPAGHFAFVCDLGTDKVMSYRLDPTSRSSNTPLTPNDPPFFAVKPGSGPRHLAFAPNGRFAYLISELACTITTLAYDAKHGIFREAQTVSTLPTDFKGENIAAEVAVHSNGKFVYGSNRGDNSLAVFKINPHDGTLTYVQHQSTLGKFPRHFTIDPTGKFLIAANQESNQLVVFAIDPATGMLTPTNVTLSVPAPVCLKFMP